MLQAAAGDSERSSVGRRRVCRAIGENVQAQTEPGKVGDGKSGKSGTGYDFPRSITASTGLPTMPGINSFSTATNRLTTATYDAAGNMTIDPVGSAITYDAENRMMGYTGKPGTLSYYGGRACSSPTETLDTHGILRVGGTQRPGIALDEQQKNETNQISHNPLVINWLAGPFLSCRDAAVGHATSHLSHELGHHAGGNTSAGWRPPGRPRLSGLSKKS